ncbi:MAG: hypothetical protein ABIK07_24315 [Planctomycetota bacterium]
MKQTTQITPETILPDVSQAAADEDPALVPNSRGTPKVAADTFVNLSKASQSVVLLNVRFRDRFHY